MKIKLEIMVLAVVIALIPAFFFIFNLQDSFFSPTASSLPEIRHNEMDDEEAIIVIADKLNIPWGLAFLPNGEILITERDGNLFKVAEDRKRIKVDGVKHRGEGGLLGITIDPYFEKNHLVYLYMTTAESSGLKNRVASYVLENDVLTDEKIILKDIPGAANHDGGRLLFGPDNLLYITTGDASNPEAAQNKNSLAGKILRIKADGSIPEDNPFGNAVYSYGHRNPQGLAWDDKGRLWATEHGPSGLGSGFDELNLIEKGANYGWPLIKGDEKAEGMKSPVVQSGAEETWAPAGLAYIDGNFFFAGLRGESIYHGKLKSDGSMNLERHFIETFGRLRALRIGPDGYMYVTTSNTDGRGKERSNDDKLLRIDLKVFDCDCKNTIEAAKTKQAYSL